MAPNSLVFTIQFAKELMMRLILICIALTGVVVPSALAHTGGLAVLGGTALIRGLR
jgi:hypothetical protein